MFPFLLLIWEAQFKSCPEHSNLKVSYLILGVQNSSPWTNCSCQQCYVAVVVPTGQKDESGEQAGYEIK